MGGRLLLQEYPHQGHIFPKAIQRFNMQGACSNWVEIDLSAIRHNLHVFQDVAMESGARLMPIIKSEAYGHGLVEIGRLLDQEGIWGLGISEIEEARLLRQAGVASSLFLLSGFPVDAVGEVIRLNLIPGICRIVELNILNSYCARKGVKGQPVHLKVDTGMGRLGFSRARFLEIMKMKASWPRLDFSGIYSHMPVADMPSDPFNMAQLMSFNSILTEASRAGWHFRWIHIANSAGFIHFEAARYNLVRPGLGIYGVYPGGTGQDILDLRPAMSFKSRIADIRRVPADTPIGYGHTFYTKRPSRIAVVPVGYDDGFMRSLSNRAEVLIHGTRCPVVGRICMKALMVDVSCLSSVNSGDEVVLLGRQGAESITIDELAQRAGSISYELMCLLGRLNLRIYL